MVSQKHSESDQISGDACGGKLLIIEIVRIPLYYWWIDFLRLRQVVFQTVPCETFQIVTIRDYRVIGQSALDEQIIKEWLDLANRPDTFCSLSYCHRYP